MLFRSPKSFKQFGHTLIKDAILFFKGNLDKKEQDARLLVNEITPVSEVHKKFARSLHLKLNTAGLEENLLKSLQEALSQSPGDIPVYLEFLDKENKRSQLLVDRTLFVRPNEGLVSSLQKIVGEECVSLKI